MRKIFCSALAAFMVLLLAVPVFASTETWTDDYTLSSWDTGETVIRIKVTVTGEEDPWQGETFTYYSEFIVEYWDESLTEDDYLTVSTVICEYEGDDLKFTKIKQDIDSEKIRGEKTLSATFDIYFPEGVENQYVDLRVIWVFDYHYVWIGPYTGYEYEESDTYNVDVYAYSIYLADYHKPKEGGGFCLGTILVVAVPIAVVVGLVVYKKRKK